MYVPVVWLGWRHPTPLCASSGRRWTDVDRGLDEPAATVERRGRVPERTDRTADGLDQREDFTT